MEWGCSPWTRNISTGWQMPDPPLHPAVLPAGTAVAE